MLAIRLQRTGRSRHAQFRVIVQDSRFSPKRGRVVSYLGSYNPHTKTSTLDSQKASQYLENGARPSDTVARLFKKEGIKLPAWVKLDEPKKREVRHPAKRRSTAPATPTPVESSAVSGGPEGDSTGPTEPVAASEPAADEAVAEPAEASTEAATDPSEASEPSAAEETAATAEPEPTTEETSAEEKSSESSA